MNEHLLITEIKQTLNRMPALCLEQPKSNQLAIVTDAPNGFSVGITITDREYNLYFDDYHMHYELDDTETVVNEIIIALNGSIRLKVFSRNGYDYKWVRQVQDESGQWYDKGTTAILNLRFWIEPTIRYLHNEGLLMNKVQ